MDSFPVPGNLFVCGVDAPTYRRRAASPQGRVNAATRWDTGASTYLVLQRRLFSLSDFHEPFEPSNLLP